MSTEPSSIGVNKDRPWPGPAPYTEQASPFFFGREQEAEALSRLVQASTVSVLYGASGLGKTSLLCAGLFPRLRANDFLPVYIRLKWEASSDLDSQIFAALERESREWGISCRERQNLTACPLWEYLYHVETEFWGPRNEYLTPVLVFDQFEELLRIPTDKSNWNAFIQELGDLIEGRVPVAVRAKFQEQPELRRCFDATRQNFRILFSFREDFLPHFEMLRGNIPSIVYHRSRLLPMTQSQARDAICRPGEGILASDAADAILQVAAGQRLRTGIEELPASSDGNIEPFILSLICWELNERRLQAGDTQITAVMVQRSSGEILDSFYRRTMKELPEAVVEFVEGQLVDEEGFRRSVSRRDVLLKHGLGEVDLKHLEDARLTRQEEHLGSLHVELIHDVFAAVVKRSRDARRQEKRVADADDLIAFLLTHLKEKLQPLGRLELLETTFQQVEGYFASLPRPERQKERTLANRATLYACQGEANLSRGRLKEAETAFEQCRGMRAELLRLDPGNSQYKHDFAEALGWLGDVCRSRGELDRAKKHYDECYQYADELVRLSPDKAEWQKLYGSALLKRGDFYWEVGNLNAAMQSYEEYLAICRQLAQQDSTNTTWQRELIEACNRLGHVEQGRGNLAAALEHYQEQQAICQRLAQQDPANADWQRELAVAWNCVGGVEQARGNLEVALQHYQEYLAICQRLVQQDPANAGWQRELGVAWNCIGGVEGARGNLEAALQNYQEYLAICRRLVQQDPANAGWQRELGVAWNCIGGVEEARGNLEAALQNYQESLAICRRLVQQDSTNAGWQRDLAMACRWVGEVEQARGNLEVALQHYQEYLAICQRLVQQDPANAGWQRELAIALVCVGDVYKQEAQTSKALDHYQEAETILRRLVELSPDNAGWQNDLAEVTSRLDSLKAPEQKQDE